MKAFKQIFKELFCKHVWVFVNSTYLSKNKEKWYYVCLKCGQMKTKNTRKKSYKSYYDIYKDFMG